MEATVRVTRFCKFSPLWRNLKPLGNFWRVYLVFVKMLNLLWQIKIAIGQIFIVVNGQKLHKSSHLDTLLSPQKVTKWKSLIRTLMCYIFALRLDNILERFIFSQQWFLNLFLSLKFIFHKSSSKIQFRWCRLLNTTHF